MTGHPCMPSPKDSISILFLEVSNYTKLRGSVEPADLFNMLSRLFDTLDILAQQHGVERIDSFDGCYMAAANFSASQPADHACRLARFALAATAAADFDAAPTDAGRAALGAPRLLAGMHCGAACGRVVGAHGSRKHTLHGHAVNVASRMQSHGAAGAVQCSAAAAALIQAQAAASGAGAGGGARLRVWRREGGVDVKGLGWMEAYWICGAGPGDSEAHAAAGDPSEAPRRGAGSPCGPPGERPPPALAAGPAAKIRTFAHAHADVYL